jgi:hypothetical protein
MKITTITVGWSETCSLPEYNNVKPSLTLTAQIGEDEDAQAVVLLLMAEVKATVQAQVDQTLERFARSPRYYIGPQYQVLRKRNDETIFVIPIEVELPLTSDYRRVAGVPVMSLSGALYWAHRIRGDRQVMVVDDPAQAANLVALYIKAEEHDPKEEDDPALEF